MAQYFLGQIIITPYNFAPQGYAMCNGQILSIAQNTALFSLLGTTYGGDGTSTFALPNLQGCAPVSAGQGTGLQNYDLGETAGTENVTVAIAQLPPHNHSLAGDTTTGSAASPAGAFLAEPNASARANILYKPSGTEVATVTRVDMAASSIGSVGGGQPHNNIQPYLAMNFVIALVGIFPTRN